MRWQGLLFALGLSAVLAVHPAHAQVATVVASCGSAAMQLQQGAPLIEDVNGNLCTTAEATGSTFANITSATTTTVKSGTGILHSLTINTPVASATITLYDNTAASGTKIATLTLPSVITSESPFTIAYNAWFTTGLTIVTSGATDLTVIYR